MAVPATTACTADRWESHAGRDDREGVLAVEAAYDAAWNAGDVDALADCFAEDAVLVNPRGQVTAGRPEIRERLGEFLRGEARGSRHTSRATRVPFVAPDVAIVDGEALITGAAPFGAIEHRFTDVIVRAGDRWVIAHIRAYRATP